MNFAQEPQQPPTIKPKLPKSAGVASSSSSSSTGNSRGKAKKVKLGPGFSQMDWIRLNNRASDMNGLGGQAPRPVSRAELRKHRSKYDCWMVLHGKVYNVTKYIPYHPGGFDELMRGAGIDGTKLFEDNHSWVSIDGFLEKCYVGEFVDEGKQVVAQVVAKQESEEVAAEEESGGMSWGDLDDML